MIHNQEKQNTEFIRLNDPRINHIRIVTVSATTEPACQDGTPEGYVAQLGMELSLPGCPIVERQALLAARPGGVTQRGGTATLVDLDSPPHARWFRCEPVQYNPAGWSARHTLERALSAFFFDQPTWESACQKPRPHAGRFAVLLPNSTTYGLADEFKNEAHVMRRSDYLLFDRAPHANGAVEQVILYSLTRLDPRTRTHFVLLPALHCGRLAARWDAERSTATLSSALSRILSGQPFEPHKDYLCNGVIQGGSASAILDQCELHCSAII